jgi:murein DD-endopeptidase MepM/ murein hydrolase activator NlpD
MKTKKNIYIFLTLLLIFSQPLFCQDIGSPIVKNMKSRVFDNYGSGQYGASRDGGKRSHNGIDIEVKANEQIKSPIDGIIKRQSFPYANDRSYEGIKIEGIGKWKGTVIKLFYMKGIISGTVKAGDVVGFAQDLTKKYPGITNHIHMEIKKNNKRLDPREIYQMCF